MLWRPPVVRPMPGDKSAVALGGKTVVEGFELYMRSKVAATHASAQYVDSVKIM